VDCFTRTSCGQRDATGRVGAYAHAVVRIEQEVDRAKGQAEALEEDSAREQQHHLRTTKVAMQHGEHCHVGYMPAPPPPTPVSSAHRAAPPAALRRRIRSRLATDAAQRLPTRGQRHTAVGEEWRCGRMKAAHAVPSGEHGQRRVAPAPVGRGPQGRRAARVASRAARQCGRAREQGEVGGEWRCGLGGCTGCRELARCITRNALRM
jgi:hypothetical protein